MSDKWKLPTICWINSESRHCGWTRGNRGRSNVFWLVLTHSFLSLPADCKRKKRKKKKPNSGTFGHTDLWDVISKRDMHWLLDWKSRISPSLNPNSNPFSLGKSQTHVRSSPTDLLLRVAHRMLEVPHYTSVISNQLFVSLILFTLCNKVLGYWYLKPLNSATGSD